MSDINVTPLVDVMLVLLIIFIITIRVIIQQVPVELPKATNSADVQTKPENITIAVDKQGGIYWNTKPRGLPGQDELEGQTARHWSRAWSRSPRSISAAMPAFGTRFVGQVLVATQQISAYARWRS